MAGNTQDAEVLRGQLQQLDNEDDDDEKLHVTFFVASTGDTIVDAFGERDSIFEVKGVLGRKLRYSSSMLELKLGDKAVHDEVRLGDLPILNGGIRLTVSYAGETPLAADDSSHPLAMAHAHAQHAAAERSPKQAAHGHGAAEGNAHAHEQADSSKPRAPYRAATPLSLEFVMEVTIKEDEKGGQRSSGAQTGESAPEASEPRIVHVHVKREGLRKAFIGGFLNRKSGKEYHHATTQTDKRKGNARVVEKFHRDTQTVDTRNRTQQAKRDHSTQMDKTGCFVHDINDKIIHPGKYMTADEWHALVLKATVTIQSFARGMFGRRRAKTVREMRQGQQMWQHEEEERKLREKEIAHQKAIARATHPRTRDDFDFLYHGLETWRERMVGAIKAEKLTDDERKARMEELLQQECTLIASIDRLKCEAIQETKDLRIKKFLDAIAAPKQWLNTDGKITEVDTPSTIRARALRDIFESVTQQSLTLDERLDVLLQVKYTVKEHDCKLTRELLSLIDREADLVIRGCRDASLVGLRKRITHLFLQFIETPEFNPEAGKKQVETLVHKSRRIHYCRNCNSYYSPDDFDINSTMRTMGKCLSCIMHENDAVQRTDLAFFRTLLSTVRQEEEEKGGNPRIVHLLQPTDIRYIVETVWNGQSSLSGVKQLDELTLCRWDTSRELSPWNCVLLTKDEAAVHALLPGGLYESYADEFRAYVAKRHLLAKNHFLRIEGLAKKMAPIPPSSTRSSRLSLVT
eukprot:Opistho-2@15459